MRTHRTVLLANYPVEKKVEAGENWHATKYFLGPHEVFEERLIVNSNKGRSYVEFQINALGSFHEAVTIELSEEQMAFIQAKLPHIAEKA